MEHLVILFNFCLSLTGAFEDALKCSVRDHIAFGNTGISLGGLNLREMCPSAILSSFSFAFP